MHLYDPRAVLRSFVLVIAVVFGGLVAPTARVAQVRVSLPSDRSFSSYGTARANLFGPRVADDLELYWNQQLLDVLLEYPIKSQVSQFSIHPRVDRYGLRVTTNLRFMPAAGAARNFEFHGDPGLLHLDPRWHQAAQRFLVAGFRHIFERTDLLLFVLCLVMPFRRF